MAVDETPRVEAEFAPEESRITLIGVVTVPSAAEFHRAACRAAESEKVSVFLEKVTRLDSSALQILLALKKSLGDGRLHLQGATGQPRGMLRLLGLESNGV